MGLPQPPVIWVPCYPYPPKEEEKDVEGSDAAIEEDEGEVMNESEKEYQRFFTQRELPVEKESKADEMPSDFGKKPIKFGLKWKFVEGSQGVDLDSSVVMMNDAGDIVDSVGVLISNDSKLKPKSLGGSIIHSGDDTTGKNEKMLEFNEIITIDIPKMNSEFTYLAILVNNYEGSGFKSVKGAELKIWEGE